MKIELLPFSRGNITLLRAASQLAPRYTIITCNEVEAKQIMAQTLIFAGILRFHRYIFPGMQDLREQLVYGKHHRI